MGVKLALTTLSRAEANYSYCEAYVKIRRFESCLVEIVLA